MGAFTTWPSWPASGSGTGGRCRSARRGRASAGAEPCQGRARHGRRSDAQRPPLTIFHLLLAPRDLQLRDAGLLHEVDQLFQLWRRSIASSPPGAIQPSELAAVFSGFSGFSREKGCILAQQPFKNLLHLRSGKRAEPAMSGSRPPGQPRQYRGSRRAFPSRALAQSHGPQLSARGR